MTQRYDVAIIGHGQAGRSLAVSLAKRGQRVALIEGDQLGGSCVNAGCTPTKTLRESARVAHLARQAAEFGVQTGPGAVYFRAAIARMCARRDSATGATVFRIAGDEIITVLSNDMATGASYRIMRQALPVYPTVAELLPTILSGLKPLAAE